MDQSLGIGYDTTFEMNEFGQPRLRSEIEVVLDVLLFILFAKPGQYPSLPFIGLDIQSMLYSFYDDIDVVELKNRIIEQCSMLGAIIDSGIVALKKTIYRGKPSLLVHIEGKESFPEGYMKDHITETNRYLIGITFDEFNNMVYNINSQGGV